MLRTGTSRITRILRLTRSLYVLFAGLALYLLYSSRADELYTVWRAVPLSFIPVFFAATLLLVLLICLPERTEFKMLYIIGHSVLSLIFYALVFPFGRTGVPQMVLGEIRLIVNSITPISLPAWPTLPAENILIQIYNWSRVYNLESLSNVIFARMFGIDIYWTNLLMIPALWGTFVPILGFAIARELGIGERGSILAGLCVLTFPTLIFWGSFSTHNSLGYIFFFASVYLFLKYLHSHKPAWFVLMLLLSLASFLSHSLSGVMAFSLLVLAMLFKFSLKTGEESPREAKFNVILTMIICTLFLPVAMMLYGFLFNKTVSFSLGRLGDYSVTELLAILFIPEYANWSLIAALVFASGSVMGLIGMAILLRRRSQSVEGNGRPLALFLFLAFLIIQVDYRIVKLVMVNVPFEQERLLVFSDLIAIPFVASFLGSLSAFIGGISFNPSIRPRLLHIVNVRYVASYIAIVLLVSSWITASVYYAYPAYGPLQTTPYEVQAVRYIEETTNKRYVVVADPWIIFAGEMFVGVHNPEAFYFFYQDPDGMTLYVKMKDDPSNATLLEAMNYNNATVAYFVIEQPRLGNEEFAQINAKAQQNGVVVYGTFGSGKLFIYYYRKQ